MKIALLETSNSHKAGGLYNSVRNLGLSLFHKGVDVELLSFDDEYSKDDLYAYEDLPMIKYHQTCNPFLQSIAYSPDLKRVMAQQRPEIIHQQGIWLYDSYVTQYFRKRNLVKTIITPRGMLDPWAVDNNKWKKKIVSLLYENENLRRADCIHALNVSEYQSIRAFGLKNPVAIIPNGITMPGAFSIRHDHKRKVLLFVGRIHPKKGLMELIDGLRIVKGQRPDLLDQWRVRIAGWDQLGHIELLKEKVDEYNLNEIISFIGPVLGDEKMKEHLEADAFVLTSFSEGLPMSVLEAWSYKLPVVMTDQCNLPDGFKSESAIRVTTEPESIARGLIRLFSLSDEERIAIGDNGYELVRKKYEWNHIADMTIELYEWLLKGGGKPEFVILD